jgi:hypothetical protein
VDEVAENLLVPGGGGLGGVHDLAAAVTGVGLAADVASPLEAIEDRGDAAGGEAEQAGQGGGGQRAGLAMGIFFLYMIVEQFVVSLGRNKYKVVWVDYLPEEVSDRLIPQPFARKLISPENSAVWEKHVPLYLSLAVLYIIIYIFFISWRFRNTDL